MPLCIDDELQPRPSQAQATDPVTNEEFEDDSQILDESPVGKFGEREFILRLKQITLELVRCGKGRHVTVELGKRVYEEQNGTLTP